jgi:hypothetical protein
MHDGIIGAFKRGCRLGEMLLIQNKRVDWETPPSGHANVQQTQRYLNVTDEELRRGLEISWQRRTLRASGKARLQDDAVWLRRGGRDATTGRRAGKATPCG